MQKKIKKKEQLEKDEFIINQEEYDIQLRELREDCNKLEQENLKYIMQLRKKEEDIEVHLNLKVELQNEISDLNENIKALEETMHKLAQKKKPLISFVRNNEHELENTKLELQKLNGENLALQQTIKNLNDEEKYKLISKTKTIQYYEKIAQENRNKYYDLRKAIMISKLYKFGVTEENKEILSEAFVEEHENLKRLLFYAKALSVKLTKSQQGKLVNVDIQNLYETAKNIHYTEWDNWIEKEIDRDDVREPEVINNIEEIQNEEESILVEKKN